jgi:hypothetical protein
MKNYTLHRINLFSLLKYGFGTGLIVSFPLVSLSIISAWRIIIAFVDWLETLEFVIPVPFLVISEITVNVMNLIRGWQFIDALVTIAALGWIRIILLIIVMTLVSGVLVALAVVFSGAIFNLLALFTGGLRLSLSEEAVQDRGVSQKPESLISPQNQRQVTGPRLEIVSPIRQVIPVSSLETLIGSGPECALRLDGLQPSHAQLSYENGRYILRDFSQGDIKVQGHPVDGVNMVRDGFNIQIGQYSMIFRL